VHIKRIDVYVVHTKDELTADDDRIARGSATRAKLVALFFRKKIVEVLRSAFFLPRRMAPSKKKIILRKFFHCIKFQEGSKQERPARRRKFIEKIYYGNGKAVARSNCERRERFLPHGRNDIQ
jgi:hypothetical protein